MEPENSLPYSQAPAYQRYTFWKSQHANLVSADPL